MSNGSDNADVLLRIGADVGDVSQKLSTLQQDAANSFQKIGQAVSGVAPALQAFGDKVEKASSAVGDNTTALKAHTEATKNVGTSWASMATAVAAGNAIFKLGEKAIDGVIGKVKDAANFLPNLVKEVAETGHHFELMSQQMGMSVQSISQLDYIGKMTGTSVQGINMMMFRFGMTLDTTAGSTGKVAQGLSKIGLSADDIKKMGKDEQFFTIFNKLNELPNEMDRIAVGTDIFGRAFRRNAQLASQNMDEMRQDAINMGLVISDSTAKMATAFEHTTEKIEMYWKGMWRNLGSAMLPYGLAIENALLDANRSIIGAMRQLFSGGEFDDIATSATVVIVDVIKNGAKVVADWIVKSKPLLDRIVVFLRDELVPAVQSLWQEIKAQVVPALEEMWPSVEKIADGMFKFAGFVWNAVEPLGKVALVMGGALLEAFVKVVGWIGDLFDYVSRMPDWVIKAAEWIGGIVLGMRLLTEVLTALKIVEFVGGIGDAISGLGHMKDALKALKELEIGEMFLGWINSLTGMPDLIKKVVAATTGAGALQVGVGAIGGKIGQTAAKEDLMSFLKSTGSTGGAAAVGTAGASGGLTLGTAALPVTIVAVAAGAITWMISALGNGLYDWLMGKGHTTTAGIVSSAMTVSPAGIFNYASGKGGWENKDWLGRELPFKADSSGLDSNAPLPGYGSGFTLPTKPGDFSPGTKLPGMNATIMPDQNVVRQKKIDDLVKMGMSPTAAKEYYAISEKNEPAEGKGSTQMQALQKQQATLLGNIAAAPALSHDDMVANFGKQAEAVVQKAKLVKGGMEIIDKSVLDLAEETHSIDIAPQIDQAEMSHAALELEKAKIAADDAKKVIAGYSDQYSQFATEYKKLSPEAQASFVETAAVASKELAGFTQGYDQMLSTFTKYQSEKETREADTTDKQVAMLERQKAAELAAIPTPEAYAASRDAAIDSANKVYVNAVQAAENAFDKQKAAKERDKQAGDEEAAFIIKGYEDVRDKAILAAQQAQDAQIKAAGVTDAAFAEMRAAEEKAIADHYKYVIDKAKGVVTDYFDYLKEIGGKTNDALALDAKTAESGYEAMKAARAKGLVNDAAVSAAYAKVIEADNKRDNVQTAQTLAQRAELAKQAKIDFDVAQTQQAAFIISFEDMMTKKEALYKADNEAKGLSTDKTKEQADAELRIYADYYKKLKDAGKLSAAEEESLTGHMEALIASSAGHTKTAWTSTFSGLADAFATMSQAAGGSLGTTLDAVGKFVGGMKVADTTRESIQTGWKEMTTSSATFKAGFGKVSTAVAADAAMIVGALKQMAGSASTAMNTLTGASTGAQVGASVGGGWGALAGGIIGGLVGFFTNRDADKAMTNIGDTWGIQISDALAIRIQGDMDKFVRLGSSSRWAAQLYNLGAIIKEAGGVTDSNYQTLINKMEDTFTYLQRGWYTVQDTRKVLDESFGAFASYISSQGILADQMFTDVIAKDRELSINSKAVMDYLKTASAGIGAGFSAMAAGETEMSVKLKAAQDALKAYNDQLVKDGVTQDTITDDQLKQLDTLQQALTDAQSKAVETQDDFDRMGRLAVVSFTAAIASGQTFLQALSGIGDGLDDLIATQAAMGFKAQGVFSNLLDVKKFAADHQTLVNSIDGINQMLTGLHNSGLLDQDTFTDLGDQAAKMFGQMTDDGLSTTEALATMRPTLQTLWDLQKRFGLKTDDATQSLLDQATASGIVGEKFSDAQLQMVDALNRLIDRFDVFLDKIAEAKSLALGPLATLPSVIAPVTYGNDVVPSGDETADNPDTNKGNPGAGEGISGDTGINLGGDTDLVLPKLAEGGTVAETGAAIIHKNEIVGSVDFISDALAQALRASGGAVMPNDVMAGGRLQSLVEAVEKAKDQAARDATAAAAAQSMDQSKLVQAIAGVQGDQITNQFQVTTMDSSGMQAVVEQQLLPRIIDTVKRNRRGMQQRFANALGMTTG